MPPPRSTKAPKSRTDTTRPGSVAPGTIDERTAAALACCSSSSCFRRETTMDLPASLYSMMRNVYVLPTWIAGLSGSFAVLAGAARIAVRTRAQRAPRRFCMVERAAGVGIRLYTQPFRSDPGAAPRTGLIDAVRPKRAKFAFEMMQYSLPDSIDLYLDLIRAIDRPAFAAHLDR